MMTEFYCDECNDTGIDMAENDCLCQPKKTSSIEIKEVVHATHIELVIEEKR